VCLAAISALVLSSGVRTATANIPSGISIVNESQGNTGKIKVSISHFDGTSATAVHFIDIIEVNVDGKVQQFTYTYPLEGNPFTVELDLGPITATSVVSVRAHCTVDGWGAWSETVPVPEFPVAAFVSVVALAATLLATKRQLQIRG
jgi:hypothetical protein